MRKTTITILACLCSVLLVAQKFTSPIAYMNEMSASTGQITDDVWDYMRTASHSKSVRKTDKRRSELKSTLLDAKKQVSKLPGYEGNTEYKAAVLEFLTIYYNVMNEDFDKIVDMEAIAEQSYDNMEAYMTAQSRASDRLEEAGNKLNEVEEKFAAENNITLQEGSSKRSEKIKIASEVYGSYNEVYLIFFKSYKQEAYLMEALSDEDVNAIEQNRSALIATAEEGVEKLKGVEKFQGDMSMIVATRDLLNFYKDEAGNDIPKLSAYFLSKEKFDKVNKTFAAIKESKRTQADIDKYNAAVNEYNKAGNDYNDINNKLNKERNELIDNWNKTASRFLDKNVPRGR